MNGTTGPVPRGESSISPLIINPDFEAKLTRVLEGQLSRQSGVQNADQIGREQLGQSQATRDSAPSIIPVSKAKIDGNQPDAREVKAQNEATRSFLSTALAFILRILSYLNPMAYFNREPETQEKGQVNTKGEVQAAENKPTTDPEKVREAAIHLMDYFDQHADFTQEGVFRLSPSSSEGKGVKELVDELLNSSSYELTEERLGGDATNLMAATLKNLVGQMKLFDIHDMVDMKGKLEGKEGEENIKDLKEFVGKLPSHQQEALKKFCDILGKVASQAKVNGMDISNLAIVVGPRLYDEGDMTPVEVAAAQRDIHFVAQKLIEHRNEIFFSL